MWPRMSDGRPEDFRPGLLLRLWRLLRRGRRRPRLGMMLLGVNFLILLLPVAGILVLRIYESALIRQTESELIAQAAFVAASYRAALAREFDSRGETVPWNYGREPDPAWLPVSRRLARWQPRAPGLDLARDPVLPKMPPARLMRFPPDPVAEAAGEALSPVILDAQVTTLSAIRVTDFRGLVVASTGAYNGLSLQNYSEVRRALRGESLSLMRFRNYSYQPPPLGSISRGTRLRVHVAQPIFWRDRVVGSVLVIRTPRSLVQAVYDRRELFFGAALVLLALVAGISLLTSLTVTRPVTRLIAQARRVGRGDVAAMAPLDQPVTREIAELSESLSRMARELGERSDYIRDFAARVSHEFKTPLTGMAGAVELLRDHGESMKPEQRDRFLSNIASDVSRLDKLVGRLLDLARADMMQAPDQESCVAATIARRVCDRFREKQGASGQPLQVSIQDEGAEAALVPVSDEYLDTILGNILENSRLHGGRKAGSGDQSAGEGPDPLQILVRLQASRDRVQIDIQDSGAGISEANAARLFEPFFTTARGEGGTGLGLPLVRSLLQAHGGEITLISRGGETVGLPGVHWQISLPRFRPEETGED